MNRNYGNKDFYYLQLTIYHLLTLHSLSGTKFALPLSKYKMGLTGIDSKCKDRARMQAGVCTALKDSYEP